MLRAIFGEKCQVPDIPSSEQEKEAIITSVRARCDQKVLQINELFPDTYPLHLPVWKFRIRTNKFLSFDKVYELVDAWDDVIQRFSTLFFAAVEADLPENDALELNLLSSFFDAVDLVMPREKITYGYIQKTRAQIQEEGFKQLSSYVRICRVIPFWKRASSIAIPTFWLAISRVMTAQKQRYAAFFPRFSPTNATTYSLKT